MRERMPTLLLALGALVVFYVLFLPKPHRTQVPQGMPLSTDGRPDGYLAIWRWLGVEHIARLSLRDRYTRLPSLLPRPTGNVLLLTLPQRTPMHATELRALKRWTARGNTVLVMAALDDTPLWTLATDDSLLIENLRHLTGLTFTPVRGSTRLAGLHGPQLRLISDGTQPLLKGVTQLHAMASLPASRWQAHAVPGAALPLTLATLRDGKVPALWLEPHGAGQIILCAAASPFSNAALPLANNARFLANVLEWSLGPGGTVVFDDAHEGLSALYDARAFFADPRVHVTLLWIACAWLAFVLGARPLRARRPRWDPPQERADLEGSARYLAAVVERTAVARRLVEDFLGEITTPAQPDPWMRLGREPNVTPRDCDDLRALYLRACAGKRIDAIRLQTLLARLRRQLT